MKELFTREEVEKIVHKIHEIEMRNPIKVYAIDNNMDDDEAINSATKEFMSLMIDDDLKNEPDEYEKIEFTLAQLDSIAESTKEYLKYYDYAKVYANNIVGAIVKRDMKDKFTDENKLRDNFKHNLALYGIKVKNDTLL